MGEPAGWGCLTVDPERAYWTTARRALLMLAELLAKRYDGGSKYRLLILVVERGSQLDRQFPQLNTSPPLVAAPDSRPRVS